MRINIASERKIIREMSSNELENYIIELLTSKFDQNIDLMLESIDVDLLFNCYKQLTGNNIFLQISDEFTAGYKHFLLKNRYGI